MIAASWVTPLKSVSDQLELRENNLLMEPPHMNTVFEIAATTKLDCFKEEQEWRLLSKTPLPATDANYSFRPGKSTIIPYYSFQLDLSLITQITIGTSPDPSLVEDTLWGLSHKYGLATVLKDANILDINSLWFNVAIFFANIFANQS